MIVFSGKRHWQDRMEKLFTSSTFLLPLQKTHFLLNACAQNSEILRRFPGLRILDGVSLERVIFPIERKPKVKHTEEEKAALVAKPFSFPVEVRPEFFSEEAARNFAMAFCAKCVCVSNTASTDITF